MNPSINAMPSSWDFDEYFGQPEMRLLVACCRRIAGALDGAGLDAAVAASFSSPFDESRFADLCDEHRLVLVVYKVLVRPRPTRFSAGLVDRFEQEAGRQTLNQLRMTKTVIDLHGRLDKAGIRHLFLKGVPLNTQLFGNELMRYGKDVDVLVGWDDIYRAHVIMGELGFSMRAKNAEQRGEEMVVTGVAKDIAYWSDTSRHEVELHWKTDEVANLVDSAFDWERDAGLCAVQGVEVPVLRDELNAVYLCQHASKHHWHRFRWLLDIPVFVGRRGIGIVDILETARMHGLETPVQEARYLSGSLLGVELGAGISGLPVRHRRRLKRRFELVLSPHSWGRTANLMFLKGLTYGHVGQRLKNWLPWLGDLYRRRIFGAGVFVIRWMLSPIVKRQAASR